MAKNQVIGRSMRISDGKRYELAISNTGIIVSEVIDIPTLEVLEMATLTLDIWQAQDIYSKISRIPEELWITNIEAEALQHDS